MISDLEEENLSQNILKSTKHSFGNDYDAKYFLSILYLAQYIYKLSSCFLS